MQTIAVKLLFVDSSDSTASKHFESSLHHSAQVVQYDQDKLPYARAACWLICLALLVEKVVARSDVCVGIGNRINPPPFSAELQDALELAGCSTFV